MKKGKLFSICLALGTLIASFCFVFLPLGGGSQNLNQTKAYASYTRSEAYPDASGNTKNPTLLRNTNIPYALYTSYTPSGNSPQITDYYPDAVEENNSYTMGVESAPYIILSSKKIEGSPDSILNKLYNTTLLFKFNTQDLRNLAPGLNYATIKDTYFVSTTITLKNTNGIFSIYNDYIDQNNPSNLGFNFQLNLIPETTGNSLCPKTAHDTYLGNGDSSFRTGLYTISFNYNYELNGSTYTNSSFSISFYVIDYSDYLSTDGSAPLAFQNASKYTPTLDEGVSLTKEYYIYNYNFENAPIVNYDASKFALNFKYYVGRNDDTYYEFLYKSFTPLSSGEYSGYVTLECAKLGKTYNIYTKNTTAMGAGLQSLYYASFDLQDFETNFILENSSAMQTSVFQGKFVFSLDLLTSGGNNETFIKINKSLFEEDVQNSLSYQNLLIYGYDLKYVDDNPNSSTYNKSVSLINDVTHTNVYSTNNYATPYVNVPDKIATTNNAPLTFFSYGDLSSNGTNYNAQYALIKNVTDDTRTQVITTVKELETTSTTNLFDKDIFKNNKSTYSQSSDFTSAGIYFIDLQYSIKVNISTQKEIDGEIEYELVQMTIPGSQYVLFEIDNSSQELYIHSIEQSGGELLAYDFNRFTNKNVRVAIEERDNMFLANSSFVYTYSSDYNSTTSTGTLYFKQDENGYEEYTVNGKTYNYLVLNQSNNFTFSNDGAYTVSIRKNNNNYISYSFKIDRANFDEIVVNKALTTNDDTYIKGESLTTTSLNNGEYIDRNLYITDGAFTLGWKEKASGATTSCYVVYMGLEEDTSSTTQLKLLKQSNNDYWLTNKYYFTDIITNAEPNYKNSYSLTTLSTNNYFERQGLWYFFLYDQAGNYTTLAVLIDQSLPCIAQGKWEGNFENSTWTSTFNPDSNPNNYVNANTYLYFGTHKAIAFSSEIKTNSYPIEIKHNQNYTNCYVINSTETKTLSPAKFDFKTDVLYKLSNVKQNQGTSLFDSSSSTNEYYLLRENSFYDYTYSPYGSNTKSATSGTKAISSSTYYAGIFAQDEPGLNREFTGEANYIFTLSNSSNLSASRKITMNFEHIQTSFYAYNQADNPIYIEKNSGTNLKTLRFVYKLLNEGTTATYYNIESLTYTYYPFVLTSDTAGYSKNTYPFSSIASIENVSMLGSSSTNNGNGEYIVDGINTNISGETLPGKYVITRTYVGGNYNYDSTTGQYVATSDGKGGRYYKDGDNYIDLFTTDQLTRSYEVYVDNYSIINTSKDIGNNIYLSLANNDNSWIFKDFSKMSSGSEQLVTNLVPVKVNIPYSKYFNYETDSNFLASNYAFSKLNLEITYESLSGTSTTYIANGYDRTSGLLTCSSLVTSTNAEGYFIFDKEGKYTLKVYDCTGYDLISNNTIQYNQNPTQMTFTFSISYSAISAEAYSYIGNNSTFETTKLTSEISNYFSTNAQALSPINKDGNNLNKIFLTFSDPKTPYISKISAIQIYSKNREKLLNINALGEEKLLALAESGNVIAINGTDYTLSTLDKATLVTTNYLCYLEVNYFDQNNISETYDGKTYYRFTYNLYFTLQEEDEFSINLLTNNSSTLVEQSTFTLSVDRTKPHLNLDNLVTNETFLQVKYKDYLSAFNDENVFSGTDTNIHNTFYNSPNNLTYSFGVSKDYALTYNGQETVSYFYIRSYDKYNGEYPSIMPDMSDTIYMTNQEFSKYPRFNELTFNNSAITIGANTWYKITYSNDSLYNQILSATMRTPQGHYEIIERDVAGNYRTFTVYFETSSPLVIINGIDGDSKTYEDNVEENLTANKTFQITKLASNLGWGVLRITNETLGIKYSKEIILKPDVDILIENQQQLQTALNAFLSTEVNSRYSFELIKYNETFGTTRRSVSIITDKKEACLEEPQIIEETDISTNTTTYKLKFPAYSDKEVLYLTQLTLKKYIKSENAWQTILNFTNKDDIVKNNPYQVDKGIYNVSYKDNYNANTYEYNIYVGEYLIEDFDKRYDFETNYVYDKETDTYYTGGDVTITFEANIYSDIIVNNQVWTTGIKNSATIVNKNCKTFTLGSTIDSSNASTSDVVGGTTKYTISYRDVTGTIQQNKTVTIVIFDELPQILLTNNANDIAISSTTFESTSQITNSVVKVNWGKIEDCEYSLMNDSENYQATVVNLYSKNGYGEYILKGTLKKGDLIKDEGYYKLELKNNLLGNARYAYFAIQFGEFPLYSVTNGQKELSPSSLEKLDITTTYNGTTTILETLKNALLDNKNEDALKEIVQNKMCAYEILLKSFGYTKTSSGEYSFSENNIGIANVKKLNHYYSTTDMQIVYNSNIDLNIVEFLFEDDVLKRCYVKGGEKATVTYDYNKYYTTIYLVYSWGASPKIQLFATTRVPVSTSLLGTNLRYGNSSSINLSTYPTSVELTNSQEIKNDILLLGFNNLKYGVSNKWYNQGNYIYCLEQYGVDNEYSIVDFDSTSNTSYNYISLKGSGTHKLKFMDLAGNVHKFSNNTFDSEPETYTLYIITKVVYYVNYNDSTTNPVENAIYNDSVSLQLDEYYTKKDKFKYEVSVVRNGQRYTNYTNENNLLTFNEAGRYAVTFTATYKDVDLKSSTYNFTILSTTSARLAYEFPETSGYEIVKVIRNNVDITSNFEKDGKVTSLFISSSDSRSGNGYYTITLKYGDKESDKLVYSFLINDYVPSISSSVEYGETTTSNIDISYNPSYIYNQLGRCYLVVYVYNSDSNAFYEFVRYTIDGSDTSSLNSFTLTHSYSYFIQVKTETGNTITSFRVDKKDPLNSFAIIIIVVTVIVVVALTIVIIKLRTRMRVK